MTSDTSGWQRLSIRSGRRQPSALHEGVPPHLNGPILEWINEKLSGQPWGIDLEGAKVIRRIALIHEIPFQAGSEDDVVVNMITSACNNDEDLCLDVVDAILHLQGKSPFYPGVNDSLKKDLKEGGSAWDIAPDGRSLVRRLDPSAIEQFARATTSDGIATNELQEAWEMAYGQHPNASDAWDHAIKACEAILIPIVCPKKDKANLGSVAGHLKSVPHAWKLALTGLDGGSGIPTLEAMLRLIWPNPDRHQDGTPKRSPTQPEAEAAVQLAVTIVQWARSGVLTKR